MVSWPSSNFHGKEMEGGKGREGKGEECDTCHARKAAVTLATSAIATCATPDILLKHPDKTFTTYV
jgi:hypothetical protein